MDPSLTVLPAQSTQAGSSTPVSDANAPIGIHCANPDCRTRAGERSRGHQNCRSLLCGHCCQNAARQAAEAGESRPICKVHSRRVHTGHKPLHPQNQPQQAAKEPITDATTSWLNASSSANPSSVSIPATAPALDPEDLQDQIEKRAILEQSLKRSITIVVWYSVSVSALELHSPLLIFRIRMG